MDVQALPLEDILKTENMKGKRALVRMDIEGYEKNITKKLPERNLRALIRITRAHPRIQQHHGID